MAQTIVIEQPEQETLPEVTAVHLEQAQQLGQIAEQVSQLQQLTASQQAELDESKATIQRQAQEIQQLRQTPITLTQEPEPEPEPEIELITPPEPETEPEPEPIEAKKTPGWLDWLLN